MYYPAFGSSAAIHLAEKYHCEWIQDITSPTSSVRRPSHSPDQQPSSDTEDYHSRIVRQHQIIGDEDEFYLSPQTLVQSYSCSNLPQLTIVEPLRERSYSLTALDAYARLDITRDTLEQMWLSLLDLSFSDKDDLELGEYKLRHIMGLSHSYSNMNETLVEKSRSHGDIFNSTTDKKSKLNTKKSKSFDITSLPKSTASSMTRHDSADVGLLQGAAISEPFADRVMATSIQSDVDANLIDMDNDSIQSLDDEHVSPRDQHSPIQKTLSPVIKEPLKYVFHYPHQLTSNNDDFDLEPADDLTGYLAGNMMDSSNPMFGEEDKQLCMALGFDDDEATAALAAAAVQPRDTYAELSAFRPHSLSTIPSSRESQYASSVDDSDDIDDRHEHSRKETISLNHEQFQSDLSDNENEHDDRGEIESNLSSPQSRPLSSIQSHSQTPPESTQVN